MINLHVPDARTAKVDRASGMTSEQADIRRPEAKNIVAFMRTRVAAEGAVVLRSREIADATGLTIYQVHFWLMSLRTAGVVEKVNAGRGRPGVWVLK
ncbi:FaeA/PapI family transcriptional regulator [Salmonella enterica subsp. enterica serovar Newport]